MQEPQEILNDIHKIKWQYRVVALLIFSITFLTTLWLKAHLYGVTELK